ncbi:MAG: heparinase II/III family protein, partial [Acidobacteria bacterium]|nr:heparinase II/III family protein [Acidobacteriota bacterium]
MTAGRDAPDDAAARVTAADEANTRVTPADEADEAAQPSADAVPPGRPPDDGRPHAVRLFSKLTPRQFRQSLRGDVSAGGALREVLRRARAALSLSRERARLARGHSSAPTPARPRLRAEFASLSDAELLAHFRGDGGARFLPGFEAAHVETARLARAEFPREAKELSERARRIVEENAWPLLGCGEFRFGARVDWLRDPLSGARWPSDFHADVRLVRGDGSDARVLWELNRLGHLVTLGQAYAVTSDERLAERFFADVEGWREQNPAGRGANWAAAMEVALRAMNLLAAFRLFRRSPQLDGRRLTLLLATLDEHAAFIRAHLEYSHLATGNHYLADVAGLLWIGLLLPELAGARAWREFGLRELPRELGKQVLPDGAHYESSTGYHRLAAELFLYSSLLCRANGLELGAGYERKLRSMLEYLRAYLRPDGRAPLVGDTDGGRALPLAPRAADDHAYLLAAGAVHFAEPRFKQTDAPPFELPWLCGAAGVRAFKSLPATGPPASAAFRDAGSYVLREGDLYLLLSASGAGLKGRGSHAHNDALSLEVSACGASFIADPGTFVYTADLTARHLFRSTAAHSTVETDGAEQNTIDE